MLARPQLATQIRTGSGVALDVRPASWADCQDLLEFLKAVTPEDLRFRFLAAVRPSQMLARLLADVDHRSREDLIAFDPRDGSIAATAMIAEGHCAGCAEIAVLVRSDLQGHGIGWAMLLEACDYARVRGYRSVECVESSSNGRAISLEREQGFSARLYPDDAQLTILTKKLI